jgi:hypothetical protein
LAPAQWATDEIELPQPEFTQPKGKTEQRDKRDKKHHLHLQVFKRLKRILVYLHGHMAQILTLKQKGLDAQWSLGLRLAGVRSVGELEVLEVFGKHLSVRALHRNFVFDALRDDVA